MKNSVWKKLIMLSLAACVLAVCVSGCTTRVGEETPTGATVVPVETPGGTDVTAAPADETEAPATEDPNAGPLAGIIICVDPGHQNKALSEKEECAPWGPEANDKYNNTVMKAKATAGTVGVVTGATEYQVNLDIALKLRDALEAQGATVVMTRTDNDSSISNKERALLANEAHCDITFNIHCNGAASESANGTEIYVRGAGDNTAEYAARSAADYELGVKLLDRIVASAGSRKRNVNKSDAYTGINWRDHTTFIVECGFMSNPDEDRLLSNPEYQDKIVAGIVTFMLQDYQK